MLLECEACDAVVDASLAGHYDFDPDPDGDTPPGRFSLLRCPRCQRPILVVQEDCGGGLEEPFTLYPVPSTRVDFSLPQVVRRSFSEALRCAKAKSYTASTVMCRKTLECICAEHGVKKKDLASSLAAMRDQGIIDSQLFDWADQLRLAGNEAAHDVSTLISSEDATDILQFTRALLEYVFTFRDRFEEFKKRRAKKGAV